MMCVMRITVTLDDDVVAAIEAERAERGESFRETLNRLVRRGLTRNGSAEAPSLSLLSGAPSFDITDVSRVLSD
jgi:hypothetical protein